MGLCYGIIQLSADQVRSWLLPSTRTPLFPTSLKELQSSGGHLARNMLIPWLHSSPRWTATFCHSAFSRKDGLIPSLCISILWLKAEQKEVQWGEPEEGKQKRQHKKELSCSFPVAHFWFLEQSLPFFAIHLCLCSKSWITLVTRYETWDGAEIYAKDCCFHLNNKT